MQEIKVKNEYLEVEFFSVGAAIYSIKFCGKDMVLNPDDKTIFLNNKSYQGAVVGPTAGRIEGASFELGNKTYELQKNFLDKHNLHGSDLQNLEYEVCQSSSKVEFSKTIYDQSYQANLDITVSYELIGEKIEMEIHVVTDSDTIINMTNHTYFNLGFDGLILDHQLQIPASNVWYLNDESLPREKVKINESILDFNQLTTIREKLTKHEQFDKVVFIDHPFELIDEPIKLFNPMNNIQLEVETNQPYLVVYTGNYLADENLKRRDKELKQFETICLETQALPNAINIPGERQSVILKANKTYTNKTSYKFTKENENE